MKPLIDKIKAAANYLAPVIADDSLLDALDSGKMILDDTNMPCLLVENFAKLYLLNDEEVTTGTFGEYENEFVFPLNEPNINLVIVYLPL